MRVHEIDPAHALAVVAVQVRHAQTVRGRRRQRERRDAHDVARVVDEMREMRCDRRHLDAVRAQSRAQRVDARDDAVHDRTIALGEEADPHLDPALSLSIRGSTVTRRPLARGLLHLRPWPFDAALTVVLRYPSSPGPIGSWRHSTEPSGHSWPVIRGSPTTATTSSARRLKLRFQPGLVERTLRTRKESDD